MVSLTFNIEDDTFRALDNFKWVSWSEIARVECRKNIIFEKYIKDKKLNSTDIKFCDEIDWHPVDRLPMKKSFGDSMKRNPSYKKLSDKELNKLLGL